MLKVKYLLTGYLFLLFFIAQTLGQQKIFVSPEGNDSNEGTIDYPVRTLSTAMGKIKKGGTVWLRGGNYEMESTLLIKPKNSGITFSAFEGETPILNGARRITG